MTTTNLKTESRNAAITKAAEKVGAIRDLFFKYALINSSANVEGARIVSGEVRRNENVYLFRDASGPSCDFYPPPGRWKDNDNRSKWYSGGAKSFINWYKAKVQTYEQQANDNPKP